MGDRNYFGIISCMAAICWMAMAGTVRGVRRPEQATPPDRALAAAHVDPAALFAKGQAALQAGDLNAAEKSFRQVLSVDSQSAAAFANLGVIAIRRKEWDRALGFLQKAEHLDSKMAGVRLNIGIVEFRRANYGPAIAPLTSVLHYQPNSAQARYLL